MDGSRLNGFRTLFCVVLCRQGVLPTLFPPVTLPHEYHFLNDTWYLIENGHNEVSVL